MDSWIFLASSFAQSVFFEHAFVPISTAEALSCIQEPSITHEEIIDYPKLEEIPHIIPFQSSAPKEEDRIFKKNGETSDSNILQKERPTKPENYTAFPLQGPQTDTAFFDKVSTLVGEFSSDCAKFVNRMMWTRYRVKTWGNAWDMQRNPDNKRYLDLVWKLPRTETYKNTSYWYPWGKSYKRGLHFEDLYRQLDSEDQPLGVLGFLYRYSNYRDIAHSNSRLLPQTHVAFLAGKATFSFTNKTDIPQRLTNVINEEYGVMKDYEEDFVGTRIDLEKVLEPGESYAYNDYLVEEHFNKPVRGSLLEIFLRKHRNNRVDEVLRPVSFSRLSADLLENIQYQKDLLTFYDLNVVPQSEFETYKWDSEEHKQKIFDLFEITNPERAYFLPVPKS